MPILPSAASLPPRPATHRGGRARARFDWRRFLYIELHLFGFVATTLLLVWGVMTLFLLALGGFSLDGLMAQLDNLASRYVAADLPRQNGFKTLLGIAQMALAVVIIVVRRKAMLPSDPPSFDPPREARS